MSKEPKQSEKTKKPESPVPNLDAQGIQITLNGMEFKSQVLQKLVRYQSIPMLVVWYDTQFGLCTAVGNDLRVNSQVRKSVGLTVFKIVADLKLFDDIATKAD